jgi:hypothetical protein
MSMLGHKRVFRALKQKMSISSQVDKPSAGVAIAINGYHGYKYVAMCGKCVDYASSFLQPGLTFENGTELFTA